MVEPKFRLEQLIAYYDLARKPLGAMENRKQTLL
jgi:hypothetical protein